VKYDQIGADCANTALCLGPFLKSTSLFRQAQYISGTRADFMVPGDYTSWTEFTIAADLPERFRNLDFLHLRFSRATISLQGRNLALWTKYTGTDPRSELVNQGFPAFANGVPQARAWSFRFDFIP